MSLRSCLTITAFFLVLPAVVTADEPNGSDVALVVPQKEYQQFEPILVVVRGAKDAGLPMMLDEKSPLRFEISPPVKPRKGAKPLPVEAKIDKAPSRTYDLLEWYQFPAEGTFTLRAVMQSGDRSSTSSAATIVLRSPAKTDFERTAVDRLHHLPWSNYCTDCFCGDTFDVVKSWPKSRLVPYCHYWNGIYSQHKKEHDKAATSFRTLLDSQPTFVLADHAAIGLAESLIVLGRRDEATKVLQTRLTTPPDRLRTDAAKTVITNMLREAK